MTCPIRFVAIACWEALGGTGHARDLIALGLDSPNRPNIRSQIGLPRGRTEGTSCPPRGPHMTEATYPTPPSSSPPTTNGTPAPLAEGGSAIEQFLAAVRARIAPRAEPMALAGELADGTLVVDIRPESLRRRDGDMEGAVIIERNVLEWRLDPTSPDRLEGMDDPSRRIVIVCDEGYASSLAAAALRDLGLTDVTDLAGGYQAWRHALGKTRSDT
jgi:rhodanese-related sulfurtransferase